MYLTLPEWFRVDRRFNYFCVVEVFIAPGLEIGGTGAWCFVSFHQIGAWFHFFCAELESMLGESANCWLVICYAYLPFYLLLCWLFLPDAKSKYLR